MEPEQVSALCAEQLPYLLRHYRPEECEFAFFGGSFTAIERSYMISLLEAVQPYIGPDRLSGIRISTRPDAISREILQILKDYRVTAVELGCQSMSDDVLARNRRGHTADDTRKAAGLIRESGLSLGVQMMVGLPGDTEERCMKTAQALCALKPDTVRIYPAVTLENTQMAQWYREGVYIPMDLDRCVDLCARLIELFEEEHVRVIRVGLQAQSGLESQIVAGPYHPAFRQLCSARRIFRRVADFAAGGMPVRIVYPGRRESDVIGQHRTNVKQWQNLGLQIQLQRDDTCEKVMITVGEKTICI